MRAEGGCEGGREELDGKTRWVAKLKVDLAPKLEGVKRVKLLPHLRSPSTCMAIRRHLSPSLKFTYFRNPASNALKYGNDI